MRAIGITVAILLAAGALQAQPTPMGATTRSPEEIVATTIASLQQNQTLRSLSQAVRSLETNMNVSDSVKAQADALAAEATSLQRAGSPAEARRRFVHAIAILRGLPWDEEVEFAGSLLMQIPGVVDSSVTLYGQLAQIYAFTYPASNGLKLHVSLMSQGTPPKLVRDLTTFDMAARDFTENPFRFSARLDGVADGPYKLVAEVSDGGSVVRTLAQNIVAVQKLEGQRVAIEQRLAKIQGHDSAKATVRYPFDYARVINIGGRDLIANSGPEDPNSTFYDFSAEIKRSLTLVKSLESGKDPLVRAKGDHERHYDFAEAGEIMPYHVFVPSKYDGKMALPLVVILHGAAADENTYFKHRGPVLVNEAEKHGFIVVTPLGYRPSGGWGRSMAMGPAPAGGGREAAPAAGVEPAARGRGGAPLAGAAPGGPPRSSRQSELSEKDALNVIELVAKEYAVDRSRMYLMGNSMGGNGTWYIGTKYADKWAAIAPCGSPSLGESFFPIDRLKTMPLIYTNGEKDNPARARTMVAWAKDHGLEIPYTEVKNGTHDSAPWDNLPNIFNFFDEQRHN